MIVWLNGTFGVGKTTASSYLAAGDSRLRHFDPEWVGYMLANNLSDHAVTDFQHYPSWRRLVPLVAHEIVQFTGQHLVAAQTVLVEDYWRELVAGLADLGHEVFHVLLDADSSTLHTRIDTDEQEPAHIRPWRHKHVETFESALEWLRPAADLVVDTGDLDADATAMKIRASVDTRLWAKPTCVGGPRRTPGDLPTHPDPRGPVATDVRWSTSSPPTGSRDLTADG